MILVDTSVWIELLNGKKPTRPSEDDLLRFVTCGPVVQEVLQGLRDSPAARSFRRYFEAVVCLADPLPLRLFNDAAEIYRQGRRRGLTIRASTDCLIAAIAIEYETPVWHRDRDFDAIATYTRLQTVTHL
jgi:hypothetical protein